MEGNDDGQSAVAVRLNVRAYLCDTSVNTRGLSSCDRRRET